MGLLGISILIILNMSVVASSAEAADWPCFHGPGRDNIAVDTGLMQAWPQDGPKLLWTASDIGHGYSSVSISGARIFTAGMIDRQTRVTAMDMTGKRLWQSLNGQSWQASERQSWAVSYAGSRGTPTVDGNTVYHLSEMGSMSAFDTESGRPQRQAGGDFSVEAVWKSELLDNHHGGVLLLNGRLYGAGHESRGWFCLDFKTGRQLWKAPGKGSLTCAGDRLYCLDEKGTMTLVKAAADKWQEAGSSRLPRGGKGLYWAHPVVCSGRLYVRHSHQLFAYDIGRD